MTDRIRTLVVVGGRYHDEPGIRDELAAAISAYCATDLTITDDLSVLSEVSGSEVDVVLVYTTGRELDDGQERSLLKFVAAGGGFVGLHGATTGFKQNPRYQQMIGSTFIRHPKFNDLAVTIDDAAHPITQGVADFTVPDELYVLEADLSRLHVLATSRLDDLAQPTAYTKAFGDGRVYYLALGHDARCLRLEPFRRLLGQGIAWVAAGK